MLPRSRGAIGQVRAAPGALSTAGRSVDGAEGARTDIPGTRTGKGLTKTECADSIGEMCK